MYFRHSRWHALVGWLLIVAALLLGVFYWFLINLAGVDGGGVPILLAVRTVVLVVTLLFAAVKLLRLNARSRVEFIPELAVTKTFSWLFFITGVSYLPYLIWPTLGSVPAGDLLIVLAWLIAGAALRRPRRSVLLAMTVFLLYVAWAHLAGSSGTFVQYGLAPFILLYLMIGVLRSPWRLTLQRWPLYLMAVVVTGGLIYAYGAVIDTTIVAPGQAQAERDAMPAGVTDEQLNRVESETLAEGDTPIKQGYPFTPVASVAHPYDYLMRGGAYQLADKTLTKVAIAASQQNPINNFSGSVFLFSADRRYVLTTGYTPEGTALYLNDLVNKQEHRIALIDPNWMVYEYLAMSPDTSKLLFRGSKQQLTGGGGVGGSKKFYFIYDLPSGKVTPLAWMDRAEFPNFYELDKPILGWDTAGLHIIAYDKKLVTGAVRGVRAGVYDLNGKEQSRIPLVDGDLPNHIELNGILLGPKLYIATTYTTALRDYLVYSDGAQTTLNDLKIEKQYGDYSFYNANSVRYSPSTNKIYFFFSGSKELKVVDVAQKKVAASIMLPADISGLTVVNGGTALLVDSTNDKHETNYYLVDLTTGAIAVVQAQITTWL